MKKFISIFLTFLSLLFFITTIDVFAQPASKTLTQGIYNARDTNLLIGTPITVSITPSNSKAIVIVIDSNQVIQALIRLTPQIPQQVLPPLDYNYSIIIFGNGTIVFS